MAVLGEFGSIYCSKIGKNWIYPVFSSMALTLAVAKRVNHLVISQKKKSFTTNSIFWRTIWVKFWLLEETKIEHKGLFLNVDTGFESKKIREILSEKEIMANILKNPRNGENFDENSFIFDKKFYEKSLDRF